MSHACYSSVDLAFAPENVGFGFHHEDLGFFFYLSDISHLMSDLLVLIHTDAPLRRVGLHQSTFKTQVLPTY